MNSLAHAAYTTRELPPSEYDRLSGTELGLIAASLPDGTKVIVVEDAQGQIIGCWSALLVVHTEGFFIAQTHRKYGSVARRLLREMTSYLQGQGFGGFVTASMSDEMDGFIHRLGGKLLPGKHFMVKI